MINETLDIRDEFLTKNGRRICEVKEVKVRDIIGGIFKDREDVQLNYVDFVHSKPDGLKFDYFPMVKFKGPCIGFHISPELLPIGFKYFSINPKNSRNRTWTPSIETAEMQEQIKKFSVDEETLELLYPKEERKNERVYILNEGEYRDLGNLIPLVELPSFSFLPQSRDLEELIGMIKGSKEDFEVARAISDNIKRRFKQNY